MDEREHGPQRESEDSYLHDLPDGCGCTEVWEHLSEQRSAKTVD